ncbi:MAG TPA: metalloregulator ArsR/SmtB family transcription factor [Solirubrobacteraceae bacterium]|nr:metalloregulator ArsR/SmtB family transcription factor [Solirubrobacteraceae bacterium]
MPDSGTHAAHQAGSHLNDDAVSAIAETMQALTAPSRVRLLFALRDGERTVGVLAEAAGITPAAASQQLRVLRHLKLVVASREGQSMLYRLHDEHVISLLDEVRNHAEHAARGWASDAAAMNRTGAGR